MKNEKNKCLWCGKEHENNGSHFCSEECKDKQYYIYDHETDNDDGPECPFCGHVHEASYEPETYYDEGLDEVECDECGRKFQVAVNVSWSWNSRIKEEDVEAEMVKEKE